MYSVTGMTKWPQVVVVVGAVNLQEVNSVLLSRELVKCIYVVSKKAILRPILLRIHRTNLI